jgi:hypothetical protein
MSIGILFDSLGAQVQVQNETKKRLTTWTRELESAGYTLSYTDYTKGASPPCVGRWGSGRGFSGKA